MNKTFLKGMYYIPNNANEDPYSILKNANKNKLNFIIIEYTNNFLFSNNLSQKKQLTNLFYIQEKINMFEKKHKNTIGILSFKCRSVIGPIRILLSKSIFKGEIFKLKNFYLWCYLNNPTLILSNSNYSHIETDSIKKYFTLHSDNFLKSTDKYIDLLNDNLNITPIYTNNGFIFIKNINTSLFDFSKIKQHIVRELKEGNFYISNCDKFYLNVTTTYKNKYTQIQAHINNKDFSNYSFMILNNKKEIIKTQNFYNLKNIYYNFEIKNNANKFLLLKILSKNNLFALTSPIYLT